MVMYDMNYVVHGLVKFVIADKLFSKLQVLSWHGWNSFKVLLEEVPHFTLNVQQVTWLQFAHCNVIIVINVLCKGSRIEDQIILLILLLHLDDLARHQQPMARRMIFTGTLIELKYSNYDPINKLHFNFNNVFYVWFI
jgi:hypothetical protein